MTAVTSNASRRRANKPVSCHLVIGQLASMTLRDVFEKSTGQKTPGGDGSSLIRHASKLTVVLKVSSVLGSNHTDRSR